MSKRPRDTGLFDTFRTDRRKLIRTGIGALAAGGAMSRRRAMTQEATPVTSASTQVFTSPGILVYPTHESRTASPYTEISFCGTPAALLGTVRVDGSQSGGHSGLFKPHADGSGGSFLPDAPFEPGETVMVSAGIPLRDSPEGEISFQVSIPAPKASSPAQRSAMEPHTPPQSFRSRPDLRPPVIKVTTDALDTAPGYIFVAPKVPDGQSGVMILDDEGELIWYAAPVSDMNQCNDFRVQEYHGQPVLTWWEGASPVGYGFGHYVIENSALQRIAEFSVGNGFPGGDVHEFPLTPQGTALVIIYHPVRWNLSPIKGALNGIVLDGIVQEIEIETGRVLFEWHSLDHIEIEETFHPLPKTFGAPLDYVHVNSVDMDPDGNLFVSGRHTHAVYKIDRSTGGIVWRLNGKRSDFTMGAYSGFRYQHDARMRLDGRLTLFDNAESNPKIGGTSRGVVLDLDEETMSATLVQEYIHPTEILSVSQGNMQTLPHGNVVVGWGSAPVFSEFGPDGDLRFNGRFPRGVMSYRAFRLPWSGLPAEPPDVAVEQAPGNAVTVFASWNGATDVASWRLLSGQDVDRMRAIGTFERRGFETEINLRTPGIFLAVEALDAAGRVMGLSETVVLSSLF